MDQAILLLMLVNAAGERRRDAPGGCFCAFDAGTGARAGGGVLVYWYRSYM